MAAQAEGGCTLNGNGRREERTLRYTARAGLLPELTRQTYDSFSKALREAILNSLDAGARRVVLDFSRVSDAGTICILDDGSGIAFEDFAESFMGLGGSSKFGDDAKFGRIGIGSLALLPYAEEARVRTKMAGEGYATHARLAHPWTLLRDERRVLLEDFSAGSAFREDYDGDVGDHFTEITLTGLSDEVYSECSDVGAFYRLVERLRRVLPLPWCDTPLKKALRDAAPDLVERIDEHASGFSATVIVRSAWSPDTPLSRRTFGEDANGSEVWDGPVHPIDAEIGVRDRSGHRRELRILGYLLSQRRARPEWSGITARVQNVAVAESTYFGLESDPGFRRYVSGEVFVTGDVDRARLINIDRTSFNSESADYRVIERYMAQAINDFKTQRVQRPQRLKADVRRVLNERIKLVRSVSDLLSAADVWCNRAGATRLPSSNTPFRVRRTVDLARDLAAIGADVIRADIAGNTPFELHVSEDGTRLRAAVGAEVLSPSVAVGRRTYAVQFVEARSTDPPVVVRNRPAAVLFNLGHRIYRGTADPLALQMSLALELAYLCASGGDDVDLYQTALELLSLRASG